MKDDGVQTVTVTLDDGPRDQHESIIYVDLPPTPAHQGNRELTTVIR